MWLAFKVHNNGYHNYVNISNNCIEYLTAVLLCVWERNGRANLYEGLLGRALTTRVSYDREYGSVYSQTRLSCLSEAVEKVFPQAIQCSLCTNMHKHFPAAVLVLTLSLCVFEEIIYECNTVSLWVVCLNRLILACCNRFLFVFASIGTTEPLHRTLGSVCVCWYNRSAHPRA